MLHPVVIIGGGAAGFFAAAQLRALQPKLPILMLERSNRLLHKVRISGGGRCNVTHHCFEAEKLATHYPRGEAFLREPFMQFGAKDTVAWFKRHGVALKTESDGRMFPTTDNSETIAQALEKAALQGATTLRKKAQVLALQRGEKHWKIKLRDEEIAAKNIVFSTGGQPAAWTLLKELGLEIVPPVPSLFTFNTKDTRLRQLAGLSVAQTKLQIKGLPLSAEGPLLVTHWGLSGPGILRLSAWGARLLHDKNHQFTLRVNFLPSYTEKQLLAFFRTQMDAQGKRYVHAQSPFAEIPKRLWASLVAHAGLPETRNWAETGKKQHRALAQSLLNAEFSIHGKSTFKEEFVTAGGVDLTEINPKTLEANRFPGLYFAGEVLDIDAITGGFNFQAAWTTATLAARAISGA